MKLPSNAVYRPTPRLRLRIGVAIALSSVAIGAEAAGLGRLNVLSSIGQPLRAEIELTAVGQDEASTLTARLASPDAFGQANIDYGAALTGLRFAIQRRPNGQPYVLMTSNAQLNEPFLDVLVELTWGTGRLVREYTLLIDPPETRAQRAPDSTAAPIVQAQSTAPAARTPRAPRAAVRDSVGGSAVGAARAATPAGSGSEYVVRSGDTAMSIARDNKPEGVALEQMLAALYRDNPQAFSGNINRLLAGATVRLPDGATAQSLDAAEARRIVAQSANFGAYRDRIARDAPAAPASRAPGQQASGRLSTQVDDGAAAPADAKDRLQLSRPDGSRTATAGTGPRTGVGAPSDELAAKDRELQETRTRLSMLEKQVGDLTKLLEMKNQSLAGLQGGAAATVAGAPPAGSSAGTAAAPAPSAASPAAATPSVAPATPSPSAGSFTPPSATTSSAPATEAPSTPPTAAPTPPPAPAAAPPVPKTAPMAPVREESWFDSVRDNGLLMAALAAVLLLLVGYGLFTIARRRKLARFEDSIFVDNSVLHANSVFGTTGGQSVDTANSGFHSNFVPVAGTLPEQNEVDPVAEADVYIAYGRDAQAEEILKEALRNDGARPAVRLKLLEIYAKRGDAKSFETMASELYATTGGQGDDWAHAAALGMTIDPRNPLYSESAAASTPPATAAPTAAAPAAVPPHTTTITTPPAGPDSGVGTSVLGAGLSGFGLTDLNLGTDEPSSSLTAPTSTAGFTTAGHTRTDPMPRAAEPAPAPSMDLDFDLGFGSGAAPLSGAAGGTPPAAAASGTGATPPRDGGLDFDVGQNKPLIDPFTASAFGAGDASARTAVNLPAFRARADHEPPAAPEPAAPGSSDPDGFSASDIFGSSIIGDTRPMFSQTHPIAPPPPTPPASTPAARPQEFRDPAENQQFDKTEPFEAFGGLNLDLDHAGGAPAGADDHARTDVWQAMATKLDLALAYSDIGDKDGARELLEEVVRHGDPTQSNRARQLIGDLG